MGNRSRKRNGGYTCIIWIVSFAVVLVQGHSASTQVDQGSLELKNEAYVVTRVDRDEISIGDRVHYTVTVGLPAGAIMSDAFLEGPLGEFDIIDFGRTTTSAAVKESQADFWYNLTTFSTGYHVIPAPRIPYVAADGTTSFVEGEPIRVHVGSLLAQERAPSDIRDIKPPEDVPIDWFWYVQTVVLLLSLVGGAAATVFYMRKRRTGSRSPAPLAPDAIALRELELLLAQRLAQAGEYVRYYVELSAIIRTYLENGFGLHAPEMTTEEFLLAVSRDVQLSASQRGLLDKFLSQADLVKFAKHVPSFDVAEGAFETARRFVEESAPARAQEQARQHGHKRGHKHAAA